MTGRRSSFGVHGGQKIRGSKVGSRMSGKRSVAFDSKSEKIYNNKKPIVQVFDNGLDVTPKSLLTSDVSGGTGLKVPSKPAINFNDSSSIIPPSDLNRSIFGTSNFLGSYSAGFSKSIMGSMASMSSRTSLDSVTDGISEPLDYTNDISMLCQSQHFDIVEHGGKVRETLTESDLDCMIDISLEETETICLLDMSAVSVSTKDGSIGEVKSRNEKYDQLCNNRQGNDMYVERGMQTFDNSSKTKEVQTTHVAMNDKGCMATNWDLYDVYNQSSDAEVEDDVEDDFLTYSAVSIVGETQVKGDASSLSSHSASNVTESCVGFSSEASTIAGTEFEEYEKNELNKHGKPIKLDSLKDCLFIMERAVIQNQYHLKQAYYRGLKDLKLYPTFDSFTEEDADNPSAAGPTLLRLWSYECPFTRGLAVKCIVSNKSNNDIVAVGYSEKSTNANGKGLICIWSIKNPQYPERIFIPSCRVTSMDFSVSLPYLLGVGLSNGTIVLYNIQNSNDDPLLDTTESNGKHSAPIWQLKWVERDKRIGNERGEVLVSASGDGRITQWSIRKGFEFSDLIKLKRVIKEKYVSGKKSEGPKRSDARISQFTSVMCFDFHARDGNIYLAGSEDGYVHYCSCFYNEQYLETYSGHKGPVYRVVWSPFDKRFFLTCSSDWSICLWHVDQKQPLLTLQGAMEPVIDIDWSPVSPVLFAAINEKQIEIWDLSRSTLDPLCIQLPVTKVTFTSIRFALNSNALIVGDYDGHVTIYLLNEMNLNGENIDRQSLSNILLANIPLKSANISSPNGVVGEIY